VLGATSALSGPAIAADGRVFAESELLELAGDGRLAIVVSGDARSLSERVNRSATSGSDYTVRSLNLSAANASMSPLVAAMNRESLLPRSEWPAALRNPWSGRTALAGESFNLTYLEMATESDPDSLRSALAACGLLGRNGGGGGERATGRTVRVLMLEEPVDQAPAADAASVLWWSASPAKWSRPVLIPVIIEE